MMSSLFAVAQHRIRLDIDPLGGDDGAAIQPRVATDADDRLRAGGDEAIDLGVRPGINVSPELHSAGTGNPQPAIPEEARSEVDVAAPPIWQGGHPSETARGDVPPWHGMRAYWAKDGARMTVIGQSSGKARSR